MLNQEILLSVLKDNFDYIKDYTDQKVLQYAPCYRIETEVLRIPLNDLPSSVPAFINIDTLNLKNGDEYLLEFCGCKIYSNVENATLFFDNNNEPPFITMYVEDKVRAETLDDYVYNDKSAAIFIENLEYSEPTTDFVFKKVVTKYLPNEFLQEDVEIENSLSVNKLSVGNGFTVDSEKAVFENNLEILQNPTGYYDAVNKRYVDDALPCKSTRRVWHSVDSNRLNEYFFNKEGKGYNYVGFVCDEATVIDKTKRYTLCSYQFKKGDYAYYEELPLCIDEKNGDVCLSCFYMGGLLEIQPEIASDGKSIAWYGYSKQIEDPIEIPYDFDVYEYSDIKELSPAYLPTDLSITNSINVGRTRVDSDIGKYSLSCGYGAMARGNSSQATGFKAIASGFASHAEGDVTTASGWSSHAEGQNTIASGDYSHAEGYYTIASGSNSHVQGKYNIKDTESKYAHIVGNGTSNNTRANAHTVDWKGNAWYKGNVYIGGTGQDDANAKKLATEEFVNNNKVTKTSELTNDSGFVTSIPNEYITETELTAKNYIDNTTLESKGYLTEHQDLSDYALRSDLHTHSNKAILDAITSAKITEWNNKSTFSGSYNDLTNKPTIPTITNDLTNALKANYDAAYTHSQSAHAPSNAQKNSDITKAEIEAKLTGNVTTHTHSQYLTEHQDISGLALKSELHTHTNKSILDAITSDKISSWDSKSTFSGSYNDLADKPTFATESYVDNKFASEEIIFEGQSNDPLVLFDYYTHVPIDDGMAFWVIDKTLEINSTYNPYTVEISGCQPSSLNGTYGPELFTYNSTYDMWECNLGNGFKIQLGNTEYQGSNKMIVSWDTAGNYSNLKVTKRVDLMNTINSKVDKAYVDGKVSDLVNSSPATLDTLKELADALGNDPNFATTVSNQIGNKVDKVSGKGLSTNDLTNALKANYDAAYAHSQAAHAPSNAQKNSDITKAEIEAKLTGNITTHTHSQYLTSIPSEYITEQELTSKGYITEDVLTSKGYATESQINSAVEAVATTDEEVKTTVNQILGGAYIE